MIRNGSLPVNSYLLQIKTCLRSQSSRSQHRLHSCTDCYRGIFIYDLPDISYCNLSSNRKNNTDIRTSIPSTIYLSLYIKISSTRWQNVIQLVVHKVTWTQCRWLKWIQLDYSKFIDSSCVAANLHYKPVRRSVCLFLL